MNIKKLAASLVVVLALLASACSGSGAAPSPAPSPRATMFMIPQPILPGKTANMSTPALKVGESFTAKWNGDPGKSIPQIYVTDSVQLRSNCFANGFVNGNGCTTVTSSMNGVVALTNQKVGQDYYIAFYNPPNGGEVLGFGQITFADP